MIIELQRTTKHPTFEGSNVLMSRIHVNNFMRILNKEETHQ